MKEKVEGKIQKEEKMEGEGKCEKEKGKLEEKDREGR